MSNKKRNRNIKGGSQIKPESNKGLFYRKLALYLSVPLIFAIGTYYSRLRNCEELKITSNQICLPSPFEIKDSNLRQGYLEEIIKGRDMPWCSGVVYDSDGSKIINFIRTEVGTLEKDESVIDESIKEYEKLFQGGYYDAKTPEILELSGTKRKTKIFVGRQFFEDSKLAYISSKDFESIIANHENHHTIQYATGLGLKDKSSILNGVNLGLISKTVYYHLGELDADYHELRNIFSGEFKVSQSYREDVKKKFLLDYIILYTSLKKSSPLQKELIEKGLARAKDILPRGIDIEKFIREKELTKN